MAVRTYQYRLEPLLPQRKLFGQFAGNRRKVWNVLTSVQQARLAQSRPFLSIDEMDKMITQLRRAADTPWLKQSHVHTLQSVSVDMDRALGMFRKGHSEFVKFKKKHKAVPTFRYKEKVKVDEGINKIFLPKIGWVTYRNSRPLPPHAKVTQTTVKRAGDHWFACVCVEVPDVEKQDFDLDILPALGIDMGVTAFASGSSGYVIRAPIHFARTERRKVLCQRRLSRKVFLSKNWIKQKRKLGKVCRKEANCRKDFLHKESTKLAQQHSLIVMEALEVKRLTKSARGTVEAPGKNIAVKTALNKRILDVGMAMFRYFVGYKLADRGGELILINPAYTSQTCFKCKHCCPENRPSQAVFHCVACGHRDNADRNAARNILAAGLAVIACGGRPSPVVRKPKLRKQKAASKQEPPDQTAPAC